jgi:hypothetical protein
MLETARMRMMPWQPDEWLLLRPLATDPEVVRYISNGEPWPAIVCVQYRLNVPGPCEG